MAESGGHQIPPETGTTPAEAYQVGFDITIFVSNYVYYLYDFLNMIFYICFQWAYSIVDSSRVSTFFISILLIVYGSFRYYDDVLFFNTKKLLLCLIWLFTIFFSFKNYRSLALEEDKNLEDTKDKDESGKANSSGIQTLDSLQAMCLPLGASVSLLVMFFFFDSMQMLFAICTAVIATVALAFLLLPMCQYLMRYVIDFMHMILSRESYRLLNWYSIINLHIGKNDLESKNPLLFNIRPCGRTNKISLGFCGRFTSAELFSFSISMMVVFVWILTGIIKYVLDIPHFFYTAQ